MPAAPQRLLVWLARVTLPRAGREWMAGDLEEEHAAIVLASGHLAAARWLLAETLRNLLNRLASPRWEKQIMHTVGRDLRYAVRLMRVSPGFTAIIVLTLALGIGANTAIFSVVDALLFKPLPYPGAERLYSIVLASNKPEGMVAWPYPKYAALAREQDAFDLTAAYSNTRVTIDPGGQPLRVEAEAVTSSYFPLFGAQAALGRVFSEDEERVPARDAVVVIGDALWRSTFGADATVIGRTVIIKDRAYAIVGVMPPSFRGQSGTVQLWLPVMMADHFYFKGAASESAAWWMRPVGRLEPKLSAEAAAARMPALSERVGRIEPSRMRDAMIDGKELFQLRPFRDTKIDPAVSRSFVVLLAAVGFVLIIACANTANLLLGRAMARQGEFAVRLALGASRRDIIRQVLVESLVLAGIAGVSALAVAKWTLAWLVTAKPMNVTGFWSQYGRTFDFFSIGLDGRVAAFNIAIALAVGLAFGLLPARQAARMELNEVLKLRSGSGRFGARAGLVLAEIAFSVILLASAGLMVRSFSNAANAQLGFQPDGVMSMTASLQKRRPVAFYRDWFDRVRALPGVESAALATAVPLSGGSSRGPVEIEGRPKKEFSVVAAINVVTPGFFSTMGIRTLSGRSLSEQDNETSPRVAVVSLAFARSAWPGEDALGKRFRHDFRVASGDPKGWTSVVGVVDDVVYGALEDPGMPIYYLPAWQPLGTPAALSFAPDSMVIRTASPAAVVASVRAVLHAIDPASPLYDVMSMEQRAENVTSRYRYSSAMMSGLAVLALLLAAIGTYAVIAYSVATRTREIGIRMALGARPGDVLAMLLGSGMKLTAAGLVVGLAGAFVAARAMTTMLFGVSAHDPWTFTTIAGVMTLVAGLATYLPARRAMRVQPTQALRRE